MTTFALPTDELRRLVTSAGSAGERAIALGALIARGDAQAQADVLLPTADVQSFVDALLAAEDVIETRLESTEGVAGRPGDDDMRVVVHALDTRADAECVRLAHESGSCRVDREDFELLDAACTAFDLALAARSHRLVAFEVPRASRASSIIQALRARFHWYTRGRGIAPGAVAHLADVAQMVATFPSARSEFDRLVAIEDALRSNRPANGGSSGGSGLAPAAAPADHRPVVVDLTARRERLDTSSPTGDLEPTSALAAAAGLAIGVDLASDAFGDDDAGSSLATVDHDGAIHEHDPPIDGDAPITADHALTAFHPSDLDAIEPSFDATEDPIGLDAHSGELDEHEQPGFGALAEATDPMDSDLDLGPSLIEPVPLDDGTPPDDHDV